MKKQLSPAAIAIVMVAVIGVIFGVLWAMSEAPKGKAEDFGRPMPGGGGPPAGAPTEGASKAGEGKAAPPAGETKPPPGPGS